MAGALGRGESGGAEDGGDSDNNDSYYYLGQAQL